MWSYKPLYPRHVQTVRKNTDASILGIGACLKQVDEDGMLKAITFVS